MSDTKSERTVDGRFAPGNKGGPGNPFARRAAALRKAAIRGASADDVADVMATLKMRAKAGDVAAARLWLAYTVGRPNPFTDPDEFEEPAAAA